MIIASMYPCPFGIEETHDQNATIISSNSGKSKEKCKIFSYEEEKITAIKEESTVRFPERSLMMGMKELNVYPDEVDFWVFTKPPKVNLEEMYYFKYSIPCKLIVIESEKDISFKKIIEEVDRNIEELNV